MIHYGVTKTGQLVVARGLAEMTKGTRVTVNSVLPGPTRTEAIVGFLQSLASTPTKGSRAVSQFWLLTPFLLRNKATVLCRHNRSLR